MVARRDTGLPARDPDQHFLVNPRIIDAVAAAAGMRDGDRVAELGAGAGTVAARFPPVAALDLVELDPGLCARLRERFDRRAGTHILCEDALQTIARARYDVIVSNLPADLTPAVLDALAGIRFRAAVVAAPAELDLAPWRDRLRIEPVATAAGADFDPPQPFETVYLAVHRLR